MSALPSQAQSALPSQAQSALPSQAQSASGLLGQGRVIQQESW
jgi:hypothetical protein